MSYVIKLTALGLSLTLFFFDLGEIVNLSVAFFLIIGLGIPHGSTDQELFNQLTSIKDSKRGKVIFYSLYLSAIAVYALLWYLAPTLSFLLFILISAYHFGETQYHHVSKSVLSKPLFLIWGLLVLLGILLTHPVELTSYIVPYLLSQELLDMAIKNYWFILTSLFFIWLGLLLYIAPKNILKEILDLLIISVVTYFSSLILGFAIFFAFWHSRDAIQIQLTKLAAIKGSFSWKAWSRLSLPFSIISYVGVALLILLREPLGVSMPVITMFFVLVSIITLPHSIVMSRFIQTDFPK